MKDFISAKSETRIERGRKGDASKAAPAAKRGATGRGGARQCRTPSSPASRVWRLASLVLCAGVVGGGAWDGNIPEPSSGTLLLLGVAALGLRRRT